MDYADENNVNLVHQDNVAELEEVREISHFATAVVNWHTNNCNQAIHAMNMPEHVEGDEAFIQVQVLALGHPDVDPETGMRVLKAEEIPAFKAGIRYLFDLIEELPFKFLPTDADGNVQPEYASTEDVQASNEA